MGEEELVDRIVRTVDAQTTPKQPDAARPVSVISTLAASGSLDHGTVRKGIQSALDSGQLNQTEDGRLEVSDPAGRV
jgi:hypothetical protein